MAVHSTKTMHEHYAETLVDSFSAATNAACSFEVNGKHLEGEEFHNKMLKPWADELVGETVFLEIPVVIPEMVELIESVLGLSTRWCWTSMRQTAEDSFDKLRGVVVITYFPKDEGTKMAMTLLESKLEKTFKEHYPKYKHKLDQCFSLNI